MSEMARYKIIGDDGREYGPVPLDDLKKWILEGRLNRSTRVLSESDSEWRMLDQIPVLADMLPPPVAPFPNVEFHTGPKTNQFALVGLILGILSVTLGLCCCDGIPFSLPGLVVSIIGLRQVKADPSRHSGKGLAIAGLILCILSILLFAVVMILGFAVNWDDIAKELKRQ